ncbi:glycoside hydrolase family 76 protein [Myriangium duriaei CBS 260.36]|uniref:Glycoside hydrolase family 76 protein n=1 Tax=Myriangium duriaei CBS 260.36 TaxID=1168546 RepID=A0A9P4JD00_9PEZI|nr:glycoside hydrolase family 76 protein [Myriangium duriaei CBS 260.36]
MRILIVLLSAVASAVTAASAADSAGYKTFTTTTDDDLSINDSPFTLPSNGSYLWLSGMYEALQTMQDTWFQLWVGTWPTSIDWTAAVLCTYVTSALESLSLAETVLPSIATGLENQIEKYYDQTTAFYFGENTFALRNEANDDALWVVLNWLTSVRFTTAHSLTFQLHSGGQPWHGVQYIPAFAHRARIFYEIAAKGWNTTLCGGGMIWNNNMTPYKNAVTNELFISASMDMYLFFPGDNNSSPYSTKPRTTNTKPALLTDPYNQTYLNNAVQGYNWLNTSNMTNTQGLYVDGFHIRGWNGTNSTGTRKCDERNEMVYTYNQGVLLSGLRHLWEATNNVQYLLDAHAQVRRVIAATNWVGPGYPVNTTWAGLGRAGILEDFCDANATCNQDAQTFKGIYFTHLSRLCQPLPPWPRRPGITFGASRVLSALHLNSCRGYGDWVRHNAVAANSTRDAQGRFGMWWAAGLFNASDISIAAVPLPSGAIDYRNLNPPKKRGYGETRVPPYPLGSQWPYMPETDEADDEEVVVRDANDRGRGRTVETQGGGVAVMRAAWEITRLG